MRNPPPAERPLEERSSAAASRFLEGIVLKVVAGAFDVQTADTIGKASLRVICALRGKAKKTLSYSTSGNHPHRVTGVSRSSDPGLVAVGDRVQISLAEDGSGFIEKIHPRSNRFSRRGFRGREQTMLTNLDQLAIVFACSHPDPDLVKIDRWLAAAEANSLDPLLIANKRELVSFETFNNSIGVYRSVGYRVIETSAKSGEGLELVREALNNRISAFTGPSGVGKSSLLNALQPGLGRIVGEVGSVTRQGRHTTTVRELFALDSGGWVADTPGLRQLDLTVTTREELAECFTEFAAALAAPCRFTDCQHSREPGCRLKLAVETGQISERRYRSFLTLAQEIKPQR